MTGALSWGGVAAILLLGPVVDRLVATAVVTVLFLGATCGVFAIGFVGGDVMLLAVSITLCGGCITAGRSFSNVLAANLYPTTIRSTGVAWALGVGRTGTMLGLVVGSVMLAAAGDDFLQRRGARRGSDAWLRPAAAPRLRPSMRLSRRPQPIIFPLPPFRAILKRKHANREASMAVASQGRSVNVTQVIDGGRFGNFQWIVAIWCFVLVTLDGFDNGAIGFVAPVIVKTWSASMPAFASVFAAGLFGLMLGALASGPIADRFGRKIVVLISTLTFAVFALATALAHSIDQLYILRFLTGLGVGGLMPNSIALTAEYAPKRIRATVVAIMFLGFPLGAGGGGFIGAALIPSFGWQSLFVLGGLLPLILLPIAIYALPESIRFLVLHGGQPARVAALLNRLDPQAGFDGSERFGMAEEKKLTGFAVVHLLTEGRAVNTALLWITFFSNLLIIYYLNSWLPLVLREAGVPLADALRLGGLVSWGGIASTLILGPIVDRFGAPGICTGLYVLAAISVFAIGLSGANIPALAITITAAGMCVIGGQSFINVLSAVLYPTGVRSTGVGWALGIGRIGAIVGPVIGGVLLAAQFAPRTLFFMIAVPALVAALAMLILSVRLRHHESVAREDAIVTAH